MSYPSNYSQPLPRNRLLSALSPGDLEQLAISLQPVELPHKKFLFEAREPIEFVYFLEAGMVSLLGTLADGSHVEAGVVGREGMVGTSVILGVNTAITAAQVQLPGHGYRIRPETLQREMDRLPGLRSVLLRYVQTVYDQVTQTATCNARHLIDGRLARWLLMAHDRADGDVLLLTHELLAMMLGVRRPGVTVALRKLEETGSISHRSSLITVCDRPALEAAACECYQLVRQRLDETLLQCGQGSAQGQTNGAGTLSFA